VVECYGRVRTALYRGRGMVLLPLPIYFCFPHSTTYTAGCARVFLGCCGILKIDSCYDAVNFDGLGNEILRRRNIFFEWIRQKTPACRLVDLTRSTFQCTGGRGSIYE
jgi:hypothetical protein